MAYSRLLQLLPFLSHLSKKTDRRQRPGQRQFLLNTLPRHGVGVEIGVHEGDFSALLLRFTQPRELHLIDPWKHEDSKTYERALYGGRAQGGQAQMDARYAAVCQRFSAEVASGQVHIHRGFSDAVMTPFPDGSLDWVYIDGNHLYEFVRKDLELSLQKTKPGGYIAGDDYDYTGWWGDGVKKAVDEFARTHPVETIGIRHGQFILRKKG